EIMAGEDIFRCRPGLVSLAHGSSRFSMTPFVKFPFMMHSQSVEPCKLMELFEGEFPHAEFVDVPHPDATDKMPDAAIVIVIRKVEKVDRVIRPPVRVAGRYSGINIFHGKGLIDTGSPDKSEGRDCLVLVHHIEQMG